jgi:hypothetical protein
MCLTKQEKKRKYKPCFIFDDKVWTLDQVWKMKLCFHRAEFREKL